MTEPTRTTFRASAGLIGVEALAYAIVLPHLPVVVATSAPWWSVGFLFAGYSIAQFLALGPLSRAAERYGPRQVVAVCLVGTAVGLALTALSTDYWVLLAGRLIDGASAGTVVVVTATAISWFEPSQWRAKLGRLAAVRGAAAVSGIVITAAIGLVLADPFDALRMTASAGTLLSLLAIAFLPSIESLSPRATPRDSRTDCRRPGPTGRHLAAQSAQASLIVLAPAIGLISGDQTTSFIAPVVVIVAMAIGQLLLAPSASSRIVRAAVVAVAIAGAASIGPFALPGLFALGVGVGTAVPTAHAGLLDDLTGRGVSDYAANASAGRTAIIGQLVGPLTGYVGLAVHPTVASGIASASGVAGLLVNPDRKEGNSDAREG